MPFDMPPAVPLVTHDPYFSIWSITKNPAEEWTRHWTGHANALCSMVQIDGKAYRLMAPQPESAEKAEPVSADVTPLNTRYFYNLDGVSVEMVFTSPVMPDDIDVASRPVTYVTWNAASTDGRDHVVKIYLDCAGEIAADTHDQPMTWSRFNLGDLTALRIGTVEQPVLEKKGDDLQVDWGYLYLSAPSGDLSGSAITGLNATRNAFAKSGVVSQPDSTRMPRPVRDDHPGLAMSWDMGSVSATTASRHAMLAYDQIWAMEYMNQRLRPWWRRNGANAGDLLADAEKDYPQLLEKSAKYDAELTADLKKVGGKKYATLAAWVFRQTMAAHKIASDFEGKPIMLSKENASNGCIGTVDVLYPASPFFLLFNTELLKAQLRPVLDYSASARWKFPFAPHDLGTYPLANGQVYGGGERTEENQMPVEECGNMLILLGALAVREGNADFVKPYWPVLKKWAEYLEKEGMDPGNQLCTDDFAGHLAHNTNLSIKAIEALGCYGLLCQMDEKKEDGDRYLKLAKEMAAQWVKNADDGDHYRLTFDKPGTWSLKYNLVWDKLLGLNLFTDEVATKEMAWYKTKMNEFGVPLDSREDYTKLDWEMWTACLTGERADFDFFMGPLYKYASETPSHVPMSDWYFTSTGKLRGFKARSVVGGLYMPMLFDQVLWDKYSARH